MTDTKILVVEDESIVAKDIQTRLKNLGYTVCGVTSTGADAVKKAVDLRPDLVIMDIMLKDEMDGITASEKIRKLCNIPVIYITAYGDENTLNRAKITEPFGYILKPFEERELHINIEIALYKHKIEKKLKSNEEWLSTTLNSIGDSIITTDKSKQITFMNPAAEELTGWKKEDAIGKNIFEILDIFSEKNYSKIDDPVTRVINEGIGINLIEDIFMINKKEQEIFITCSASPLKDNENSLTGVVLIFHDITEKKQAKELFQLIVESTSTSIGEDFFKLLVKQLATTLKVRCSFICEYFDPGDKKARVISSWIMDHYGEQVEYEITNTPCEKLLGNEFVYYPSDLKTLFPNDRMLEEWCGESYLGIPIFDSDNKILGFMGVIHDKPMKENETYKSIMRFLAVRASAELQRKKVEDELIKSKEKYKELANSLPQTIFEMDKDSNLYFVNEYGHQSFGYTTEDFAQGLSILNMLIPEDQEKAKENIKMALNGENLGFSEYTAIRKDNTLFPVLIYSKIINDDKNITIGLRGIVIDISELRKTEDALRESEERYTLTVQGTNDGFWDWNIKTNEMYFSSRWKTMIGFEENEIGATLEEWFKRVHPDDITNLKSKFFSYLEGTAHRFESEYRLLHRDGTYRWMLTRGIAVRNIEGNAYRMAGSQADITSHKITEQMLEKLLHNVSHDSLTGLPNRSLFIDRLERCISYSRRKKEYLFAVLFIDIDRFKIVNDSLGHSVGDLLLIETSKRLLTCLRPEDTIARLGGDEFAILLEEIVDTNDAIRVSRRIQKELKTPFSLNSHDVFTSASIGIAIGSSAHEQPEELLRDADLAMYKAKTQGRARHEVFDSGMHTHAIEILQLETDLRRAVERQEFLIHYQPIISLYTGKIIGFEALIRWMHPLRGFVPSDKFIPIAEETGLIIPIGHWVLKEACTQIKIWQNQFPFEKPLTISVNISGKQFSHPHLIEQIYQIIKETELEANNLKLEITESTIMENAETARSMLFQLRDLNIQLQIDDFGTGYSSLSYLHRFPVNTLKIDRSFVSRIGSNDENLEIVKTIILLAKNLGMEVIAEGIETEEQLIQLRNLNCEYGQGYYFAKPMDRSIIEKFILSTPKW